MVEKYRSIEDIRDLTSEQVQQIATMQSIQASLLEYYYQFQIAVESQSKLNEIAYTVAITVITTALTLGIGSATGWSQAAIGVLITEPLEEVFIDPVLEAVVSRFVEILGGDEYAQMIASTLAESGREGAFGITSQKSFKNMRTLNQKYKHLSKSERRQAVNAELQAQRQAQESSTTSKVAKVALMTLSIFGMLTGIGGIFGGLGGLGITSLSAFLIDNGGDFIDFFRNQQEQLGIDQDPLQGASQVAVSGLPQIPSYNIKLSHVSDYIKNMKGLYELSNTQKPKPSNRLIDKTLNLLAVTSKPKYQIDPLTGALKTIRTGRSMVKDNLDNWGNPPKDINNARPKELQKALAGLVVRNYLFEQKKLIGSKWDSKAQKWIRFEHGKMKWQDFVMTEHDIELNIRRGIVSDMKELIGVRGFIKYGFFGFSYRVEFLGPDINIDGERDVIWFQDGISRTPHPIRKMYYGKDAIQSGGPGGYLRYFAGKRSDIKQIYGYIYDHLNYYLGKERLAQLSDDEILSWMDEGVNPSMAINFKITGVFGGRKLLRLAEIERGVVGRHVMGQTDLYQFAEDKLGIIKAGFGKRIEELLEQYQIDEDDIGKGLNDLKTLGRIPKKSSKAYITLMVYFTAMGLSQTKMHEALVRKKLYKATLTNFHNEFKSLFGSMENARRMFLRPVTNRLLEEGHNIKDVKKAYPVMSDLNIYSLIKLAQSRWYTGREIAAELGLTVNEFYLRIYQEFDRDSGHFPDCPLYSVSSTKNQKAWSDLRIYLLAPIVKRMALDGSLAGEVKKELHLSQKALQTIVKDGLGFSKFNELGKKNLNAIYFALLKNPMDFTELLADSEVSKYYTSEDNLKDELYRLIVCDKNSYYIKKYGELKMIKLAVVGPILLELLKKHDLARVVGSKPVIRESHLKDFFSSEQEILEYIDLLLSHKGLKELYAAISQTNYLGTHFTEKTGVEALYR